MATADESALRPGALAERLDRDGIDAVHVAVAAVVVAGLAARLYALGARPAHWDEARVGYWILEYAETGDFEYRPIVHGPFYQHVNAVVFDLLGPSETSMRLVVALLTGLFPLVALLFRGRLRDVEVAALAVFFAFNPVLLYYSRFMRGDPLVAVFMVAAFACFVRAVDSARTRYVHAGVVSTALGFTVKENALLYLLAWLGALAILADYRVLRRDARGHPPREQLVGFYRRARGIVWTFRRTLVVGVVEFVAVIAFFYAPRAGSESGPGLYRAVARADPFMLGTVLREGTVGAWQDMWGVWVSGGHQSHPYPSFFVDYVETLAFGALAVCLLAVVGFLVDRYSEGGPRDLVSVASYWGAASVLGYPLVTDIQAPWATIHAVVPLAIPAAVGVGVLVRIGRPDTDQFSYRTLGRALLVLVVLVATAAWIATTGVSAVYENPQSDENDLVQYAQPADDVGPAMARLDAAAPNQDVTDAVLYGDYFVEGQRATGWREPGCAKWLNALPLPWYFVAADADVACAENRQQLDSLVEAYRPPVVVAREPDEQVVDAALERYESRTYRIRAWGSETVVFVAEEHADGLPETGQ